MNSSKANVERLEQLQAFERVTAPFDGVVTARNTDIGALVQAGDNSGPKELFHVAAIQTLRVYVAVPEIYAALVKNGEQAKLTLDALPGETLTGTIVRNADAIDATSRTLNVEVDVDNPSGPPATWGLCVCASPGSSPSRLGHHTVKRLALPRRRDCGQESFATVMSNSLPSRSGRTMAARSR